MGDASVRHTYYEKMKGVIDPAFFVVTGFFGLEKLRSVELINGPWINGPMTHQAMALAGAVNGLTIYLVNRMGQARPDDSPYYKAVLTIIGLTAGALVTPYAVSKVLKSHALLITSEMSFRIAAFNLVAKVAIYVAFTKAEKYYNAWNFPAFHNFDEMTEHTVQVLYDHFKGHADLWRKESFKKQLGFNQVLQKYGLDPLVITEIDLEASLTKSELKTFRKQFEKGELTREQATLLYNFPVPPQEGYTYNKTNLPIIDPRTIKEVEKLSDEQVQWHHQWFIAHPALTIPKCQIQAFVPRFYRQSLVPPYKEFVAELPLPNPKETLTKEQVSYLANFYQAKRYRWDCLRLSAQIILRDFFAKYGFEAHPLKEPEIDEMDDLEQKDLKEFREYFKTEKTVWQSKGLIYQEEFNKILSNQSLKELEILAQPWSTKQKVAFVGFLILEAVFVGAGVFMLANRATQLDPNINSGEDLDPTCIGENCSLNVNASSHVGDLSLEISKTPSVDVDDSGDLREGSSVGKDQGITLLNSELEEHVEVNTSDEKVAGSGFAPDKLEGSDDRRDVSGEIDQRVSPLNIELKDGGEKSTKSEFTTEASRNLELKPTMISLTKNPEDYVDTGEFTLLKSEVNQVCDWSDLFFGSILSEQDDSVVMADSVPQIPTFLPDETSFRNRGSIESASLSQAKGQTKYANQILPETDLFTLSAPETKKGQPVPSVLEDDERPSIHFDQESAEDVTTESQEIESAPRVIAEEEQVESGGVVVGETGLESDQRISGDEGRSDVSVDQQEENDEVSVQTDLTGDPKLMESEVELRGATGESDKNFQLEIPDKTDLKDVLSRPDGMTTGPVDTQDQSSNLESESSGYGTWITGGALLLAAFILNRLRKKQEAGKVGSTTVVTTKSYQIDSDSDGRNKSHMAEVERVVQASPSSPSKRSILRRRLGYQKGSVPQPDFSGSSSSPSIVTSRSVVFEPESGEVVDFGDALSKIAPILQPLASDIHELISPFDPYVKVEKPNSVPFIDYHDKESVEFSMIPDRFLGAQISRGDLEKGSFFQLLDEFASPSHQFHYLNIDAARMGDEVVQADGECVDKIGSFAQNSHVQRLTLAGFKLITRAQFDKITQQFPNVVSFDFRGSGLEEDLIATFSKKYILQWNEGVEEKSNIEHHHKHFYDEIAERREAFASGDLDAMAGIFDPNAHFQAHRLDHPLGPFRFFVENVSFLNGLNIDDDFIHQHILEHLYKNFPNARALDLSGCQRLTSNTLDHMAKAKFKIESLILRECSRIFKRYRRSSSSVASEPVCDITAIGNVVNSFKELVKFISYVDIRETEALDPFGMDETELPRDKIVNEAKTIAVEKGETEKYWNRYVTNALERLYPTGKNEKTSYWSEQGKKFWFLEFLDLFARAQAASSCHLTQVMYNQEGKASDQMIGRPRQD